MTKQKKPKTGDVVGWVVIDRDGDIFNRYKNRERAREAQKHWNTHGDYYPYAIGKVVKP